MEERSSASEKVPTKEECQPAMLLKKKLEKKVRENLFCMRN